ncbi:FAD-binding oxidoreductase [Pseudonocardia bannensis]|uniref:FAD-binding protein n=1 Tax=Pseudonocardia bannensis TaxID=630973 RepID=A0A848DGH5_9PSEU|nr:FAD-binding protein [Pseudonocardia bannensis]NMH91770.1 FAD-binding protein [Pseudonocardia bannensis]
MTAADDTTAPTTLRPTDLRSVREAVLDSAGGLAIAGAGTAAAWGGDLDAVDSVLDMTGVTGVIAHNPGDMTVSVHAGTPLRRLNSELAPHGQQVSLDAARIARGATVGGLVATADAGPAALVHGSLRDLVIGTTVVLADGTVARSGGHVIKNVAGYDLAKLVHGSYGTLGVLVEVVLRLHPVPKRTTTVALDCPLAEASGHARRVLDGPYEPVALEWRSDSDGSGDGPAATEAGRLLVRVEGTEDALSGRARRLRAALGPAATEIAADAEAEEWAAHAERVRGGPGHAVLRLGALPSALPGLLAALPGAATPDAALTIGLGTGVATAALPADAEAIEAAHRAVHAAGGTSALRDRPTGFGGPAWGPAPSAVGVLKAVKTALDPAGRFGPGRFAPWFELTSPGRTT